MVLIINGNIKLFDVLIIAPSFVCLRFGFIMARRSPSYDDHDDDRRKRGAWDIPPVFLPSLSRPRFLMVALIELNCQLFLFF